MFFLGYPQIFFRFLSKFLIFREIFWVTPRLFSDFCQKNDFFGVPGYPQIFFRFFSKNMIFRKGTPRFFTFFLTKKRYFDKYLVVPPDFFNIFDIQIYIFSGTPFFDISKNILGYPQIFIIFKKKWVTHRFFQIVVKKSIFKKKIGYPQNCFRFLSKFTIFWKKMGYP